jgi:hypothetical protein
MVKRLLAVSVYLVATAKLAGFFQAGLGQPAPPDASTGQKRYCGSHGVFFFRAGRGSGPPRPERCPKGRGEAVTMPLKARLVWVSETETGKLRLAVIRDPRGLRSPYGIIREGVW